MTYRKNYNSPAEEVYIFLDWVRLPYPVISERGFCNEEAHSPNLIETLSVPYNCLTSSRSHIIDPHLSPSLFVANSWV